MYMVKSRISIKLNDYEYSILYRIQTSCTLTGVLYNRSPPLNEIIRGLISFVYLDITKKHENLDLFFRTIKTDSEYPYNIYNVSATIPINNGNYIFIADEEDIEILEKIEKITEKIYHEKYDMPKLIRYCIHYTLYGNEPILQDNMLSKKYYFLMTVVIGNLYYLLPRISVELMYEPLVNLEKFGMKNLSLIRKINIDKLTYLESLQGLLKIDEKKQMSLNKADLLNTINGEEYQKFNSKVSSFNYITAIHGLLLILDMWQKDSFDWIRSFLIMWLSEFRVNIHEINKKERNKEINFLHNILPPLVIYFINGPLKFLLDIFKKFMDISEKAQ